jgi:ubiquinone/menaquinone biosynthesis C-methylase UbiE
MSRWTEKLRVMRLYDQSAKVYDVQYREEQEVKIRTAMGNLTINEDSMVLDAGCGTGLLFGHVAEKARVVIGVDISRGILKEAKRKVKKHENVALILADVDNMPFPYQTFDTIFAVTTIQNTPNPTFTINEIKLVSKPNSTIVITGLRKVFTEEQFSEILKRTNLKVEMMKPDKQMKEYISVCTKMRRPLNSSDLLIR